MLLKCRSLVTVITTVQFNVLYACISRYTFIDDHSLLFVLLVVILLFLSKLKAETTC